MKDKLVEGYNAVAKSYAEKFSDELSHKHFDRLLLKAFAAENKGRNNWIELGCGPGQVAQFLFDEGIRSITGTDISPMMIEVARERHPGIAFEVADMLQLPFADHSAGAVLAFYSIVHLDQIQLQHAFGEVYRILQAGGEFLCAFHVGSGTVHVDDFLDQPVHLDFHFFEMVEVEAMLQHAGFEMIDVLQRKPYPEIEYQSQRGYIWCRKR